MTPLKIVFAGTPEFAATALAALLDTPHKLVAVYTQPDRPAGRGRKLKASPVKQLALAHQLSVYQPESFKSEAALAELQSLQSDVMVVAAYGLLLPASVLSVPAHGCLNIHASLLPRWRGAAPIQRAILAGDVETGVTIMQMDAGLDTGAMLLKKTCTIRSDETAASLHDRLAELGAEAITTTLAQLDRLVPEPQDDALATYARKLRKEEALIDWQEPAVTIDRKVRAFNPWPVAQTTINDQTLRIWAAQPQAQPAEAPPGMVLATSTAGIDIACGEGILRLTRLQPPGGKPMDIQAFLNGRPNLLRTGMVLHSSSITPP
jgi:methionyl-tRNA formyltransferase